MKPQNRIKTVLTLAAVVTAILATSAQAATTTITRTAGGDDSWNTAANWDIGQPPLTYAWSADPDDGVDFSATDIEDPTVTITKAAANPSTVTLTLAVHDGVNPAVADTMTIDVYDDACKAAIGKGLAADNPADFDGNCIINFDDFTLMATAWLDYNSLTAPVPK